MKLDNDTLTALQSIRVDGNKTTMPQLDRGLYGKVNKALECLGGRWNRGAKAHVWDCDPGDPIADAVLTGEVRDWRKELQFFPTPNETAAWMVKLAALPPDNRGHELRALEPSAGDGAIIRAIRNGVNRCEVVAVEINPKMVATLRAEHPLATVHCGDFLNLNGKLGLFDAVLMNPPFAKAQDIAHARHAWQYLKPGGRLVAITSPGWTFRQDSKHAEFADWTRKIGATKYELPEGTFKGSGTNVRTVAIHATKGAA